MRIDLYTKVVLTAIAGFLGLIALRPFVGPEVVQAQGAFTGVQVTNSGTAGDPFIFDPRTGEMVAYDRDGKIYRKWHIAKIGQPLVKDK